MIVTALDPKHNSCSLSVESAEDLWVLRRLIAKGDTVVSRSSRVVKNEDEYSRPDKGERVKVTIALVVEEVHLDSSIERIRVKGTITEASDETVTKAGSHSLTISPGHGLTLRKVSWTPLDTALLRPPMGSTARFILVAADRREAGIGALSGSHLTVATTIESGLGGKQGEEQSAQPFIAKVVGVLAQMFQEGDRVVIAGPGNFKNAIANQARSRLKAAPVSLVEGLDLTGPDGVRALIKTPAFQEVARDSVVVETQRLVHEAVRRISSSDLKVAYTLPRVSAAARAGAVEACAVSDDVFGAGIDEASLVDVLNEIEAKGGRVYLADSSMEYGKQISSFGGIVALLRYGFIA